MSGIQIFTNQDFGAIRTLEEDGRILFCGADVAMALGYERPRDALRTHCKGAVKRRTLTAGGMQELLFIPEPDLYRLAFGSRMPGAEKFTDWVTEDVLPAIRQTGSYTPAPAPDPDADRAPTRDEYLRAAAIVATCRSGRLPYVLGFLEQGGFDVRLADSETGPAAEVRRFLAECTQHTPGSKVPGARLYSAYLHWCSENDRQRPMSGAKFGREVTKLLDKRTERDGVRYFDVQLLPAP